MLHKKSSYPRLQQRGFSLVELMVVVSIIGILATLAFPRFRVFQAKARQGEAKINLSHIYTLQQSYTADNDKFASIANPGVGEAAGGSCTVDNDLGFVLENCKRARYSYWVDTPTSASFLATAKSGVNDKNKILPGCSRADIHTINEDRVLDPVNDVTKGGKCGN